MPFPTMRDLMSILEGEVVPFRSNNRPVNSLAIARGGADVFEFRPDTSNPFVAGYIAAALFLVRDEDGEPLDGDYDDRITTRCLKQMVEDCQDFQTSNAELLEQAYAHPHYGPVQAGHDFYLTRNRHGAGFWDRGLDYKVGKQLTAAAHAYGDFELVLGDDNLLHAG